MMNSRDDHQDKHALAEIDLTLQAVHDVPRVIYEFSKVLQMKQRVILCFTAIISPEISDKRLHQ